MDCLSLLSDESIQNFSDRWGWEVEYQISGGSRISPRRGRQLPRGAPTYDFAKFSQKLHEIERIWPPGRRTSLAPPLDPPLEIKGLILAIYPTEFTKLKTVCWRRSSLNPHGSATTQIRRSHWIPQDNPWKETVKYKSPLKLDMLWELTTRTSAGCFVFTMFSCRQIYFWIRRIHSCPPCK